jgi:hypothetical protein
MCTLNAQISTSLIFPRQHVFPIISEAEKSRCIHAGTLVRQYCKISKLQHSAFITLIGRITRVSITPLIIYKHFYITLVGRITRVSITPLINYKHFYITLIDRITRVSITILIIYKHFYITLIGRIARVSITPLIIYKHFYTSFLYHINRQNNSRVNNYTDNL